MHAVPVANLGSVSRHQNDGQQLLAGVEFRTPSFDAERQVRPTSCAVEDKEPAYVRVGSLRVHVPSWIIAGPGAGSG